MSERIQAVTGTITLTDGSTSEFLIGPEGWQQWAASTERLGRTGLAVEEMSIALGNEGLLDEEDEDDVDDPAAG